MNKLSNDIYAYYVANFGSLSPDKQFHFASRLQLWSQDNNMSDLLTGLRPDFTANDSPQTAVQQVITMAQSSKTHGSKNAGELRGAHFERYPELKIYVSVLFRLNFLQTIYGLDARQLFGEVFDSNAVEATAATLLVDDEALAILSTHAINFLYLYTRVIKQDEKAFDPSCFLQVGKTQYDLQNHTHLQLLIYLYTHCIIGESQFYYRSLPPTHLPIYQKMLAELEAIITKDFANINLDNKFEFLVCARLLDTKSNLQEQICAEAELSLAPEGIFLVDRHNANPQHNNTTFDKSEHRNVLFIMANREFRPTHSGSADL